MFGHLLNKTNLTYTPPIEAAVSVEHLVSSAADYAS